MRSAAASHPIASKVLAAALLAAFILLVPGPARAAVRSDSLTIRYDDTCSFAKKYPNHRVKSVSSQKVTSRQVSGGSAKTTADTAVLNISGTQGIRATGTGTATVRLVNQKDSSDIIDVKVTVEPAPLTVMFLLGQSNMEGSTANQTGAYADSVACTVGTVYSTYIPSTDVRARSFTGLSGFYAATEKQVNDRVAGSLTSNRSISGKTLVYPLNTLTKSGKGKSGVDSGLAWAWNKATGDKVYVVNAAVGATGIASWVPGHRTYERAVSYYQAAMKTVNAEVKAGHYVLKHRLLFWQQGEHDRKMAASTYRSYFLKMYEGFRSTMKTEAVGIILVRSSMGNYTNAEDIYMTGPRIAQCDMAADPERKDIWVVSNVNEQWVTDAGVTAYFKDRYPSGTVTYPLRSTSTLRSLPTRVKQVHPDYHYTQIGHNENGITAAQEMVRILKGGEAPLSVTWRDIKGGQLKSLSLNVGQSAMAAVTVSPLSASKKVTFEIRPEAGFASLSLSRMEIKGDREGKGSLVALGNGKTLGSLTVSAVRTVDTPVPKSAALSDGGVLVKWAAVEGAASYRIYRKKEGGSWAQIGNTPGTSWQDQDTTALTGGVRYSYTVRCLNSFGSLCSDYDTKGVTVTWIAAPSLNAVTGDTGSLTPAWKKVTGAVKYRVYRREAGTSAWAKVGETTELRYRDTTAALRTVYEYTVRARAADGSWSLYDRAGISGMLVETPQVTAKYGRTSVSLTWPQVEGCPLYRVFCKADGGSWKGVVNLTDTSYEFTGLPAGRLYSFTVRCLDDTGRQYISGYTGTEPAFWLKAPDFSRVQSGPSCVDLMWEPQDGADRYYLYRRTGSGSWSRIAVLTDTSYRDTDVAMGETYTYTLRSRNDRYRVTGERFDGVTVTVGDLPEPETEEQPEIQPEEE